MKKLLYFLLIGGIGQVPKFAIWVLLIWLIGGFPTMQIQSGFEPSYDAGNLLYWIAAGIAVGVIGLWLSVAPFTEDWDK